MSSKPRMYFTPQSELAEAVLAISRLTGTPASTVVAEALEAVSPYLVQRAKSLQWADDAKGRLAALAARATVAASANLNDHRRALEDAMGHAVAAIERDELRRAKPNGAYTRHLKGKHNSIRA